MTRMLQDVACLVTLRAVCVALLATGGALSACAEPPPAPPVTPEPVVEGDGAAIIAVVLERLGEDPPNVEAARHALARLHAPRGVAAKIAGGLTVVIDALEMQHVAREHLASESADLQLRLEATERALAELQAAHDEQAEQLLKLADERARLAKKLGEVESQLSTQEAELEALREELAALKRIDMQRSP